MSIGSLSNNWLLYKTLLDASRIGQSNQLDSASLTSSSFELLLQQVLLQAQMTQKSINPSDALFQFSNLNTLPIANTESGSVTATSTSSHDLNSSFKGVLQNTGQFFEEAGQKYQINPALLAAISIHETGNGTSNAARFKFNVAGMMGKHGLKSYDSIRDSIFDMARNLRENYLDKGKLTIAQIGAKYAPIGAENDPSQLNNHWVTGVQHYFKTLTGKTDLA